MATVELETLPCPSCSRVDVLEVEDADFKLWRAGTFIQVAFPYLNADQREQLKTGWCRVCWDRLMGPEE